jgi:hypothetical protein
VLPLQQVRAQVLLRQLVLVLLRQLVLVLPQQLVMEQTYPPPSRAG